MSLDVPPDPQLFPALLERFRTRLWLTQEALADHLGLSQNARQNVIRWEKGAIVPRPENLRRLIAVLQLEPSEAAQLERAARIAKEYHRWRDQIPSTDRDLFAALGVFSTAEFARTAFEALASALTTSVPPQAHETLQRLVEQHVLVYNTQYAPSSPDARLRFASQHLRACASYYWACETQEQRDVVITAFLDHFAALAGSCGTELLSDDEANLTEALRYVKAHWTNTPQQREWAMYLTDGMCRLQRDRGHYRQALDLLSWLDDEHIIAEAAQEPTAIDRRTLAADLMSLRGQLEHHHGALFDAAKHLRHAVQAFKELGDTRKEATTRSHLARTLEELGCLPLAEREASDAMSTHEQAMDELEAGVDLSTLGGIAFTRATVYRADGNDELAEKEVHHADLFWKRSLAIRVKMRHHYRGEVIDRRCLAQVYLERREYTEATRELEESLKICAQHKVNPSLSEQQHLLDEGRNLGELGCVAEASGNLDVAAAHYTEALMIAYELDDASGSCLQKWRLARLAAHLKQDGVARQRFEEAYALAVHMEHGPYQLGIALEFARFLAESPSTEDQIQAERYRKDAADVRRDMLNTTITLDDVFGRLEDDTESS